MSGTPADNELIVLMSELQSYVRQHMEQPEVLAEIRHWMTPTRTPAARYGSSPRVAITELVRAFELLAPGLMVDFLAENSELINLDALRRWAAERENLNEFVMNMTA
jgi:hypothetical protein